MISSSHGMYACHLECYAKGCFMVPALCMRSELHKSVGSEHASYRIDENQRIAGSGKGAVSPTFTHTDQINQRKVRFTVILYGPLHSFVWFSLNVFWHTNLLYEPQKLRLKQRIHLQCQNKYKKWTQKQKYGRMNSGIARGKVSRWTYTSRPFTAEQGSSPWHCPFKPVPSRS